jgi:2'-5' RNA ligase
VRLFVAAPVPPPLARELGSRIERARRGLPAARWVRPENLHLTLLFLGETRADAVAALARALDEALAGRHAVRARLGLPGAFPERGRVRVLWLGLEPERELGELALAARAAAAGCALPFDAKPFRAHLTLARCPRPWPAALRERWSELAAGGGAERFTVDGVELRASTPGPGGSRYETLSRVALAEAA